MCTPRRRRPPGRGRAPPGRPAGVPHPGLRRPLRPLYALLLLAGLPAAAHPARAQQRGDVIITEVMANPTPTNDANYEWVELFNNSPFPRDLQNWFVRDSAASGMRPRHRIASSLVVPPYGFTVLGNSTNTTDNGGVPVNYAYGTALALANSLDRVTIEAPDSTAITHARYKNAAVSAQSGISRERRTILFDTALPYNRDSMDSQTAWVDALVTSVYGSGGRGTPGRAGQTNTFGLAPSAAVTTSGGAGYRLLSPPLGNMAIRLLCHVNLVQGLSDEFPTFGSNLFTAYTGNAATGSGGFTTAGSVQDTLVSGRGFLWYMYDQGGPVPGETRGISRRADLPVTLWLGGRRLAGDVSTTFSAAERAGATSQFYMLGNPFNGAFDLSGLSASSGTLSEVFQTYDPAVGYVPHTRVPGLTDGDATDDVPVWNGFFAEFFAAPSFPVTLTYAAAAQAADAAPVAGRADGATDYAHVGLALDGTLTSGAVVHDEAASLFFTDMAVEGWDAYDASKLMPFASPAATIAPIGPGPDDALRQLAQRSLPYSLAAPFTTPVGFTTTEAGTFTFSVPAFTGVPAPWTVTLRDNETGAVTTLADGAAYTFTSEATPYSERFAITVAPSVVTGTPPAALASPYVLTPVAPNPAAATARATVQGRDAQDVQAEVFDVLGRRVLTAFSGALAAGAQQTITVDTAALPAGAYVLRVLGTGFSAAQTFHVAH